MSSYDSLKRVHNTFLTSTNRDPTDSPCAMSYEIADSLIYLDDPSTQKMKVSLLRFSFVLNWSEINNSNNHFTITLGDTYGTVVNFLIPPGNYPLEKLAQYITRSQSHIKCVYDSITNTFIFTNQSNFTMTLNFINLSFNILGFKAIDNGIIATTLVSTEPVKPRRNTELYLRLRDATLGGDMLNFDNLSINEKSVLEPSNILSVIPIEMSPFYTQHLDNSVYGSMTGVYITNNKLSQIILDVTDRDGNYFEDLPDYSATLQIGIYNVKNMEIEVIKNNVLQINDNLNRILTLKVIKGGL
jgi:hypothetical protein